MTDQTTPTKSTPTNLVDDITKWGNLEWHSGFLSRRAYDHPSNYDIGNAKMDAENDSQELRFRWAQTLLDLCEADADVTDEQQRALFSVIDGWSFGLWMMGWQEAERQQQPSETAFDAHPMAKYHDTEIRGNLDVWRAAVTALVDAHANN